MERIDKVLSNLKYGSRKEVDKYIKTGLVKVNGKIVKPDYLVDYQDKILFDNQLVFYKEFIYLLVNKPVGLISDHGKESVFDLLKEPYSRYDLNPCGRLDKESHGLMILTNDGVFIHNMTSDKKNHIKKYYVKTKDDINPKSLEKGVTINVKGEKIITKEAKIDVISNKEFYISLSEGKYHQIRLMVETLNNEVIDLKRISIDKYELDDLEEGSYKEFEVLK